jgi:hypothetical protein
MHQQVTRFTSTIDNKTSHWIVESDTTLEIAEKMCLEFIHQLCKIKEQQEAIKAQQQPPQEESLPLQEDEVSHEENKE